MSDDIKHTKEPGKGKSLAGMILLVIGAVLLVKQFGLFFFPDWLISWPLFLIILGVYLGAKNNFRNSSGVIMIIIGVAFLLGDIPGLHIHNIAWPVMIICIGIWLILKRNNKLDPRKWNHYGEDKWDWKEYGKPNEPVVDYKVESDATPPPAADYKSYYRENEVDYLDAVSIFGGVKKSVLSKDFKGGDIVNIFGGVELDFTQANINGPVVIDITQFFGGIKIIVPAHWKVVSDLAAVFASVDDKRLRTPAADDSDKVIILKGVSFFAGVDIRSY